MTGCEEICFFVEIYFLRNKDTSFVKMIIFAKRMNEIMETTYRRYLGEL